jgi:hypothetical protein
MELFRRQRKRSRASFRRCAWFVLEKGQADQSNDRDPDNRIRHNNAVPKSAAGKIVLLQHAAVCMFSDHRRLPGKRFRDKRLVSCGRFGLLEIRDHRRICDASMPTLASADYETAFSFQRTMLFKTTVNVPRLHRFDAAPVRFQNRIEFTSESDWRLCMAASRCAQHNKRATRTKRLLIKKISRAAQIVRERGASTHAIFPFCCPISLKNFGKFQ